METTSFSTNMDEDTQCIVDSVNGEGICEDKSEECQAEESTAPPKNSLRFMVENVESPKKQSYPARDNANRGSRKRHANRC